mmetsp:Transcript_13002/g.25500  ORF Transcript_13002/g.25500 Transcript_13002/m.25500 type:complete len:396 (+) Transcript_13002:288-1475(+)
MLDRPCTPLIGMAFAARNDSWGAPWAVVSLNPCVCARINEGRTSAVHLHISRRPRRSVPLFLLHGHQRQQQRRQEQRHALNHGRDDKRERIPMRIAQPAPYNRRSAPSKCRDGLETLPACAFFFRAKVHENALVQGIGAIHDARPDYVYGHKDKLRGGNGCAENCHGNEQPHPCRPHDHDGLHSPDDILHPRAQPAKHDHCHRAHCVDDLHLDGTHFYRVFKEEREIFHCHAGTQGCHQVAREKDVRHGPTGQVTAHKRNLVEKLVRYGPFQRRRRRPRLLFRRLDLHVTASADTCALRHPPTDFLLLPFLLLLRVWSLLFIALLFALVQGSIISEPQHHHSCHHLACHPREDDVSEHIERPVVRVDRENHDCQERACHAAKPPADKQVLVVHRP